MPAPYLRSPLPETPAERKAAAELERNYRLWKRAGKPPFNEWPWHPSREWKGNEMTPNEIAARLRLATDRLAEAVGSMSALDQATVTVAIVRASLLQISADLDGVSVQALKPGDTIDGEPVELPAGPGSLGDGHADHRGVGS